MFTFGYLEPVVRFDPELVLEPKTVVSGIDPPPVQRISPLLRVAVPAYRDQHRVVANLKANNFASKLFGCFQFG